MTMVKSQSGLGAMHSFLSLVTGREVSKSKAIGACSAGRITVTVTVAILSHGGTSTPAAAAGIRPTGTARCGDPSAGRELTPWKWPCRLPGTWVGATPSLWALRLPALRWRRARAQPVGTQARPGPARPGPVMAPVGPGCRAGEAESQPHLGLRSPAALPRQTLCIPRHPPRAHTGTAPAPAQERTRARARTRTRMVRTKPRTGGRPGEPDRGRPCPVGTDRPCQARACPSTRPTTAPPGHPLESV